MEGSEYGVWVRSLCCEAVIRATAGEEYSDMMADICRRSLNHVDRVAGYIRDAAVREAFFDRPPVAFIVNTVAQAPERAPNARPAESQPSEVPPRDDLSQTIESD